MPMMYIKSSIWSGFEIKNWIEDQFQSSPKLVVIWTVLRYIFVPNLEIVTSIGGELWYGQAQNGVNFDFGVQFDLEGHDQSSHKTIGILTKVFYISGPNLVILAETGDELSRGQARDWRTDGHTHRQTDAGNDNTRRPKLASGKNWAEKKKEIRCEGRRNTLHLVQRIVNITSIIQTHSSYTHTHISIHTHSWMRKFARQMGGASDEQTDSTIL